MSELNIQEIMQYIPHRYPFVMIDRVVEYELYHSLTAIKNVTINEPFFQGHFPGEPIMPGVLTLEAMAQALAVLAVKSKEAKYGLTGEELFYYAGIDNARFKRPITPGDQLKIEVEFLKLKGPIIKGKGIVTVDGQLAASADLLASQGKA